MEEADGDFGYGAAAAAAEAAVAVGPRGRGGGGGGDDAPSTSQQVHDQDADGYGGGGGGGDYYDDDAPPASDFQLLKKVRVRAQARGGAAGPNRPALCGINSMQQPPPPPSNATTTKQNAYIHTHIHTKQALLNERLAPEILHYQGDLVERTRARLEAQDAAIDRLERDADADAAAAALALERDRLRWLLKAYLRARLEKVQRYAALVLRDVSGAQARVSPQELKFANGCYVALGSLMQEQVLSRLPPNYSSLVSRGAVRALAAVTIDGFELNWS